MRTGGRIAWFGVVLTAVSTLFGFPSPAKAGGLFTPGNLHLAIEAGASSSGTITVSNPASSTETLSAYVAELTTDAEGNLGVQQPSSSSFWGTHDISLSNSTATLGSSGSASIGYTITIPGDAASADQLAAIVIATKHADLPTIYLAIPVWIEVTQPSGSTPVVSGTSSLPPTALTVVSTVTNSASQIEAIVAAAKAAASGNTNAATPASSSPEKTVAPVSAPSVTDTAEHYAITSFRGRFLNLSTPTHQLTIRNLGARVANPTVTISYHSLAGQLLDSSTLHERLVLPGTIRNRSVTAPHLMLQMPVGRLPFIGGIDTTAATALDPHPASVRSYLVPWWLMSLLAALMLSLGLKVSAFHPRSRHRHLTFRYQGRLSLAGVALIGLFIRYFSQAGFVSIVSADSRTVRQVVSVAATASYTAVSTPNATVLSFQSNQKIQIIAGGKIYHVNLADPTVSLPPHTDIVILTPFSG